MRYLVPRALPGVVVHGLVISSGSGGQVVVGHGLVMNMRWWWRWWWSMGQRSTCVAVLCAPLLTMDDKLSVPVFVLWWADLIKLNSGL